MWNTFEKDRAKLNIYDNPNFEPGSGITTRNELIDEVKRIMKEMKGENHTTVKSKIIEFVLDNTAIEVNPLDWFGFNFCGWLTQKKVDELDEGKALLWFMYKQWTAELPQTKEYIEASANLIETGTSIHYPDYDHCVPDWDSVIGLGFGGMLKRAEDYRNEHKANGTLTKDMEIYYTSVITVYKAIIRIMNRFYECAQKHINDSPKMPTIVDCLGQIREGTPKTLHQYLALTYFFHLFQEFIDGVQARTLGNLDVDGYPYYKNDLEKGRLTKENTVELFQYFYESYANMADIHAQPIYFGGFDKNGDSLINELSYLMLDAFDKSCIVSPKLFIKVMPNTPDDFLKKALDMIRRGKNSMVFVNEELGCKISRKLGRTEEETGRLVATGCNNFASRGKETTPEHVYINLAKAVELTFFDGYDPGTGARIGCETGNVENFLTFDDFKNAYIAQAEYLINKAFIISDFYDSNLQDIFPTPVYSGSMLDSVRQGKDAYYNGVKYTNTVMFLSCHATVADSLYMVKKYVYDLKKYTISQMRDALKADWVGYEEMQQTLLNDPDKYGNDIDEVDNIIVDLLARFSELILNRKNVRGGHFLVNGESITFSHTWAPLCGATPDGRKRGDLLSKNMSASIGQDRKGITAHIKSATKIDATGLPYGCPFDYMLHPSAVKGEDGLNAMLALLRTFNKRGGYGFQGSVQDAATLRDAQLHPEKYPNLQVRISGWSWFFTRMEKKYQDEFIQRAELLEA